METLVTALQLCSGDFLAAATYPRQIPLPTTHGKLLRWSEMELRVGLAEDSNTSSILLFTGSMEKSSLQGDVQPTSTVR